MCQNEGRGQVWSAHRLLGFLHELSWHAQVGRSAAAEAHGSRGSETLFGDGLRHWQPTEWRSNLS
jgi:hypothetical protein